MLIKHLMCNHLENPLGFDLGQPTLSWVTEAPNAKIQLAAQVVVSTDTALQQIVHDSGKSNTIDSLGYLLPITLEPSTRYFWRVTVWTDAGEITSPVAWFETAKMDQPWQAEWITPAWLDRTVHPLLRRDFALDGEIAQARLSICGLGLYEAEINGQKISDEYLAPFCNAYDHWIQYQTYDVTDLLQQGNNAIGVRLGNGWYKGRFGFDNYGEELYGNQFAVLSELVVTLQNGETVIIASDERWKTSAGPVIDSNIYDGETRDARRELAGWTRADYNDSAWQAVKPITIGFDRLKARLSPPVRVMTELQPARLIHTPKDEWVLDLGQNMVGWLRFATTAPAGTTIKLTHGEEMQEGCFYRENLRTAKAEFTYISDGQTRIVEPYFTFFGFRYVKIEGWPGGEPDLDAFTGCVVHTELRQIGTVETSDPLVNRLFQNALWGQKGNFLDVPTDCPQRDERMGWTGDACVFSGTACYNMDSAAFFSKYLYDLAQEQQDLDGAVTNFVPSFGMGKDDKEGFMAGGAAVWGDAATVIPWNVYLHSGDPAILRQQYPSMKAWVDYIVRKADDNGLWTKGFQFGDWLALDGADPFTPMGGTSTDLIATAFFKYSTEIVARTAAILGDTVAAGQYSQLAEKIKQAFQAEFITTTGRLAVDTQTAYVVALQFDLVPDAFRSRVAAALRSKLAENNFYLKTGFVGTPFLCRVLSENGMNDLAYQLLLNDEFPSWLYEVKMGATTIWERWNSILPDGHFGELGMNSLNHYAYGAIVEWMYRNLAGLQPLADQPGFRQIRLAPQPHGRLKWARATLDSAVGRYESAWQIEADGRLTFKFVIPFNATAHLELPDAVAANVRINDQALAAVVKNAIGNPDGTVHFDLGAGAYKITYLPEKEYLIQYSTQKSFAQLLAVPQAKAILARYIPALVAQGNRGMMRFLGQSPLREMARHPLVSISQETLDQIDRELAVI
jgi:alpha-L-rhamnosidase